MVIGVAGKYASGKDQVVRILEELCRPKVIDVDAIGHSALEVRKEELAAAFGPAIFTDEGNIKRKALGGIVFNDEKKLETLESIVHPVMREKVKAYVDEHPDTLLIINAALLVYMGLDRLCDVILWVTAPFWLRVIRSKKRDNLTLQETISRFRTQRKLKYQQIPQNTDIYTIRNNSSLSILRRKVAQFIEKKGIR